MARPAAIKLIRPEMLGAEGDGKTERMLKRFEREAQATAGLRSPHTVELYDFGVSDDGIFYYAMEYLDGLDLETFVERFGPLPAARVRHVLLQVCESLADAHHQGLTHRDIKPANLVLCRLGLVCDFVKVLDFGLVKQESDTGIDATRLTVEGATTGTPAYMAPEMVVGDATVDGRANLYALGCVGYWLLTGKPVFEGDNPVAVLVEHAKTPPVPPSQVSEMPIPPQLESVILQCLQKEPSDRFQTAAELSAALTDCHISSGWDRNKAAEWWALHMPPPATRLAS